MHEARHDPEELLEYAPGLRALAVRLVGADRADDVLQDTWVQALQKPPTKDRPPGPWLVRVLRNVAASSYRSLMVRHDSEALSVDDRRGEETPSSEVIQSELEAAELLMQAVQALDEPLKSIVSLRYFRGRTSAQIGAALDMPPPTVRWHLQRALADLRSALSRQGREMPGGWVAALLPLVRLPDLAPSPTAASMGTAARGATATRSLAGAAQSAAVVACVAAGLVAWSSFGSSEAPSEGRAPLEVELAGATLRGGSSSLGIDAPPDSARLPAESPREPQRAHRSRTVRASRTDSEPEAPVASTTELDRVSFAVLARLVDESGEPIVGAELSLAGAGPAAPFAASDSSGRVRLLVEESFDHEGDRVRGGHLLASAPGRGSSPLTLPLSGVDLHLGDVVLLPAERIEGRIVDAAGRPIAGASVHALPEVRWIDLGQERMWTALSPQVAATTTGADGRFELNAATASGMHLEVHSERHAPACRALAELRGAGSDGRVEFVLDALEVEGTPVRLRVVDPSGRPVPQSFVELMCGEIPTLGFTSDDRGEVEAMLGELPRGMTIDAVEAWDSEGRFTRARADLPTLDGSWRTVTLEPARHVQVQAILADGSPADGFSWTLRSRAETPRSGSVSAGDVAEIPSEDGSAEITVFARGASPVTVALEPWSEDRPPQRVELRAAPVLLGQVFHADRPIEGASVELVPNVTTGGVETGSIDHRPQGTKTDAEGRFELERPANGVGYTVSITAPELAPFIYRSPGFGDPKRLRRVELQRGGTLVGALKVVGFGPSQELPSQAVEWLVEATHDSGDVVRGPIRFCPSPRFTPGQMELPFELDGLAPGRWKVRAIAVRRGMSEVLASLGATREVDVEIGLASWLLLESTEG